MKIPASTLKKLSPLAALIIRLLGMTLRIRIYDHAGFFKKTSSSEACVFAFWHNRILMMPYLYKKYFPGRKLAVMISRSRDGQIISDIVEKFDIQAVRGSTSKSASQAHRQILKEAIHAKKDVAVAPDGPRGPRYRAQSGIIHLAQVSRYPLLPVTCHFSWKIQLKSWDGFQIPLPFSRCEFHLFEALSIPNKISAEERESLRLELEKKLGV